MSVKERYFRVLDYEKKEKSPLTEKQYLVYAYLLSISKWNPLESHYYVYKNSFLVKEACALIDVSQPTWRKAIKKLNEERYIKIDEINKCYSIYFDISWAKLDIQLIKFLVQQSHQLNEEFGGILPALYGVICRYWKIQQQVGEDCYVHLSQLNNLFFTDRTKEHLQGIWTMLQLFKALDLINFKEVPKINNMGYDYISYKIIMVKNHLSKTILNMQGTIETELDDTVENIIKKIVDTKNQFENYYN